MRAQTSFFGIRSTSRIRSTRLSAALASVLLWGLAHPHAHSAQVTLRWDYAASGAAGFMIHCGPSSRNYVTRIDAGNSDTHTTTALPEGATSYCAVTAYDAARAESDYSNELSVSIASALPSVSFSAGPGSGTAPLTVTFTNTTSGQVTSWAWDFGDGTGSTAQTPTHVYTVPGSYKPVLTATGPGGTATKTAATAISVTAPPAPLVSFSASPLSGTAPLNVAFTNTTTGQVTTWSWNFGDGTTSIVKNPTHVYSVPGSYTATLTATGPGGTVTKTATTAFQVTGAPAADTTPPSKPAGLTAVPAASNQIDLAWTASTDNVGVTAYRIERCQGGGCSNFSALAASPSVTSLSDMGLTPSTSYSYRVRAIDAAGNTSSYSGTTSATTQAAPDATAPTVPTGLTAKAMSASRVDLTWSASTDNVAVKRYRVDRCEGVACTNFVQVARTTATSFSNTGLTSKVRYRYRVRAVDDAGNVSAFSKPVGVTTLAQ